LLHLPPPYKKSHGHPCETPDNVLAQPKIERQNKVIEGEFRCMNWGCDKDYMAERNDQKNCKHHPGRFEFGSENGLWPEGWTCCRREWGEDGCTSDVHRGYPKDSQIRMCINHGDPNPKSKYPDSFCGKSFIWKEPSKKGEEGNDESCLFHAGFYQVKNKKSGEGIWSCCQKEERDGEGCSEDKHKFAEWPDEDAKKYFFDKQLKHPSEGGKGQSRSEFELFGRFSGYFRTPAAYIVKGSKKHSTLSADDEKK
jgi:hypothetical protein